MLQTMEIVDVWLVLLAIGTYQVYLQIRSGGRTSFREGLPKTLQLVTGIPALMVLVVFLCDPDLPAAEAWSRTAAVDLAGLALFNVAGLLILWSHLSLGDCWSGELETKPDHQLVDRGLYRWVRHPLYSSYVLLTSGLFLLSDNAWVGVAMTVYFIAVASRTWREEEMMVERLGEVYRAYQQNTGRFIPRLVPVSLQDGRGIQGQGR
jgi:protein-S-isoprenylcysteine O-methyltransferase Ste14